MRKGILPYLTPLVAFSIAGVAAYYSIFGLSRLFAGASFAVILMASVLEVGKLLGASVLHTYWKKLHFLFKLYLTVAVIALMVITSAGIYGYLSSAYKTTSSKAEIMHKELAVIEMKRIRFNESREELKLEKAQLVNTVSDLRVSLSSPHQVQYIDRESGELITTTSSSARRALQKELRLTVSDRDTISIKLEAVTDSIAKMDIAVLNKEMSNDADRELGPLKYLSELTGKSMDIVINWLMLLIIFVFDPLAIVLILITNMLWKRKEEDEPAKIKMSVPEGKEFNTPYPFTEEMKGAIKEAESATVEDPNIEYDSEGSVIIPNHAEKPEVKKKNETDQ